ncbi:MAG: hypothetical protein CYG60_02575 [Actinobacteria bacterium]|nr:MAG: hypothetical protein CYG60_02575 [Actinomycetota bacterium]
MAEDEELRIEALRQELKRDMDGIKNQVDSDLGGIKTDIKVLKYLFGAVIAVFSLLAAILASAANII